MASDKAAQAARTRFGNLQSVRENCRESRGLAWANNIVQDIRFGLRLWRKQPGSFLSATVALTLGLGLVTFSLCAINCIFFGKLPFPNADRLVYATIPAADFREISSRQASFENLCAFGGGSANFKAINAPSRQRVCFIGANFLDVIRAAPLMGRGFLPGEDKPGAEPAALIGYQLWQKEFHGNPSAIGSVIQLDGQPRTIVGIMPDGFRFPIDDQLWIPAEPGSALSLGWGYGFGRLKTSATMPDARAELNLLEANLIQSGLSVKGAQSMRPILVGPYTRYLSDMKGSHGPGPSVLALLVVTLLVLFIACANVAGLTLANAVKRGAELAVRGALGATRTRLVFQMLIENLILAICGAAGGVVMILVLSKAAGSWFSSIESEFSEVPFWMRIEIDGRVLLCLAGLVFVTNLLAGLWPALQATRRDVNEILKAGTGGVSGIHSGKLQWPLVVAQIAFSVVVLTQAFVLLVFSQRLQQVHLAFDPGSVLTAHVDAPKSANARSFFDQLEQRLQLMPGVQEVALSTSDPASGHAWKQVQIEGQDYPDPHNQPYVANDSVSSGYFRALNLQFLQGRGFSVQDTALSTPVAIVNSTFTRRYLPPGSPLGRRFREGTNGWLTIVGCVQDLEYEPLTESPQPIYFVPLTQQPATSMVVMLRGSGRAADFTTPLRDEVARLQPDLAIYRVATIRTLMTHQIIGYYLAGLLLGICGLGALFLAILGIFGLIRLSVAQRTREIGVRLALGASRRRIVATLMAQAVRQIGAGLAVGTALAFALNQLLIHSIAGYPTVSSTALVFLGAIVFLAAISAIAVLIPALRGAKMEPMVALRYE